MPLLEVDNLSAYFHTRDGVVRAVDGVTYTLEAGETLGIVGESGSGKSVLQYAMLGLIPSPPGRIESGRAIFEGRDLLRCSPAELRALRGHRIAMIFQDPMTALNPYMTIGRQVMEPLQVHEGCAKAEARQHAIEALQNVGLHDAAKRMNMYPHEFSGGMRQRVMIAMALVAQPRILIADEPTTALDVTVQAQILELIRRIQQEHGMAVVLITHDLGVVAGVSDRVLVMYAGKIMESASTGDLFRAPRHPYTRALMASLPAANTRGNTLYTIPGLPPDAIQVLPGCPFAPRCRDATDACLEADGIPQPIAPDHHTACVRELAGEL
jgi:oligopeptide transport system ATP-binding protein